MTMFSRFFPKETDFYVLFNHQIAVAIDLSNKFYESVSAGGISADLMKQISDMEHKADEYTHKIIDELNETFITPFDREDIHSLIKSIDNVADYMHSAASKMRLYQVEKITKSIRKLTEINLEACQLIGRAIQDLNNLNNLKSIGEICIKINRLESKADAVFDKAVADIFENEVDAKNIIKYKEVLSALESASDKCKSVANVLEQISVKHS